MNCPYCGQPNPEKVRFCGKCGKEITMVYEEENQIETSKDTAKNRKEGILIAIPILIIIGLTICALIFSNSTIFEPKIDLTEEEQVAVDSVRFIRNQYNDSQQIRLEEIYYYYMDDSAYEFLTENSDVDSPLKILVTYSTDSQSEVMAIIVHRKNGYSFQLRSDKDGESTTRIVYNNHLTDSVSLDIDKIEDAVEATNNEPVAEAVAGI